MTINAIEFSTAAEAFQHFYADPFGDTIISLGRGYYVTTKAEADRLDMARVSFAYLHDMTMPDGSLRVVSVPAN